jgi:hypothetical protein
MIHNLSIRYHVDMTTIGLGSAKVEVLCDMVVGFTTTYAIGAYHHSSCEFESRS